MVCKLSTRCSILAGTNPKGNLDPNLPLTVNTAIASPLLSRFDLVLLLRESVNFSWDESVFDHILGQNFANKDDKIDGTPWNIELLQVYILDATNFLNNKLIYYTGVLYYN